MSGFFKSNEVIKRKRQQELANHFTLTDAHEEQSSITLAQAGVFMLKVIMYSAFVSLGFFLPFDGIRQILTIATLGVLGFFIIKFKGIFTERLFVAQLNLCDETLPEKVHIGAEKQQQKSPKQDRGSVKRGFGENHTRTGKLQASIRRNIGCNNNRQRRIYHFRQ